MISNTEIVMIVIMIPIGMIMVTLIMKVILIVIIKLVDQWKPFARFSWSRFSNTTNQGTTRVYSVRI